MSIHKWMDKEDVVRMHKGLLLSHEKNEIMPSAATRMHLVMIILNEESQKVKDKFHDIMCVWNLK